MYKEIAGVGRGGVAVVILGLLGYCGDWVAALGGPGILHDDQPELARMAAGGSNANG